MLLGILPFHHPQSEVIFTVWLGENLDNYGALEAAIAYIPDRGSITFAVNMNKLFS